MTRLTSILVYLNAALIAANAIMVGFNARNLRVIRKIRATLEAASLMAAEAAARVRGLQRLRHDLVCGSAQGVVCPGCTADQFYQGPRGGMSINVKCAGCGAAFNYSPVVGLSLIPCDDRLYGGTPRTLAQMYD